MTSAEPIRFLLVDDVEENLFVLEALLARDGLEILRARSGAEALELLLVKEVALAFLDVQMPDMDGFELAELMRGTERTKHVPIIFVTAGARDPQRVFKGYETGAVDFLFKPLDPRVVRGKADVFFELFRQRRELSNALRLSEMFVGILGHDLRNPLAAIMTGAQVLERRVTGAKELAIVQRMTAAGQRMAEMIEQLLDLTRARMAEGLDFLRTRQRLDVASLVRRSHEELRVAFPERVVLVDARGDCAASGDPDRLLQVFSNLIANALHHGEPGGPVTVVVDGAGPDVVVSVHNRGAIPEELMPTLFDAFRARPSSSPRPSGLGLGLFIARQIVFAHGGGLSVSSTERDGTAFVVRLPRRLDD
ncbi:MAG TPA: hybrid sensor histidine kinase/response regulator [Kofleriaceae bacterium]|nr:hybrid sensor histidine kinase/response regulator [Kofleriaceae bacterium]